MPYCFHGDKKGCSGALEQKTAPHFPMVICRITAALSRPEAAAFQEHLVYSLWIMQVVTAQNGRLVKTHAVQEETSGMSWNECPVLSSKALPHQIRESSCLVPRVCVDVLVHYCGTYWGREALFVKTILHNKKCYKGLTRNVFILTFDLFFLVKMSMGI